MRRRLWVKVLFFVMSMAVFFVAGVYASNGVQKVEAFLRGDYVVKINGEKANLSLPPLIYEDRTYLPLSELGDMLGADVLWEGQEKTIYVNERIYDREPIPTEQPVAEIELTYVQPLSLTYLGREYELIDNRDRNGVTYYRVKDLQRMNIVTDGLNKWREKWTGEHYISEAEAKLVWKEEPKRNYSFTGIAVTGEPDPAKRKVLKEYEMSVLLDPSTTGDPNDYTFYNDRQLRLHGLQIYVIDAVQGVENQYEGLFTFKGQFRRLYVTLAQVERPIEGTASTKMEWEVMYSRTELLGPIEEENSGALPFPNYRP